MLKREVLQLKRALAQMQIGDRSGAMSVLRSLIAAEQRGGPVQLDSTFRCDRLDIEQLTVEACLVRRSRVWPSGSARGAPATVAVGCIGCPVGAGFAAQLPDFRPPPSTIPRYVLPPEQRRARDLLRVGQRAAMAGEREDPMALAARMTPDDLTDWRA